MNEQTRYHSPLTLAMRLVFIAGASSVLLLTGWLLFAGVAGDNGQIHVHAERIDALRRLGAHLLPAAQPAPLCDDADRVCRALKKLNQRLAGATPPHGLQWPVVSAAPAEEEEKGNAVPPGADRAMADAALWLTSEARSPDNILRILRDAEKEGFGQRGNPFRLKGCLYGGGNSGPRKASPEQSAGKTPRCIDGTPLEPHDYPEHGATMMALLEHWRQPWSGASPRTTADGLRAGRDLWLTLAPARQQQAQITAACYAGQVEACARCWWCARRQAAEMFEKARVRSVGILVIQVRSGEILAIGSAYTPCFAARQAGTPSAPGCPELPPDKARAHRLGNQVEPAEMPGSAIKPLLALGLLQSGTLTAGERNRLSDILRRSDTEAMIDIYLCQSQDFAIPCIRRRLQSLDEVLTGSGWNRDCANPARASCRPRLNVLGDIEHGTHTNLVRAAYRNQQLQWGARPLDYPVWGARLLRDARGESLASQVDKLSPEAMRTCWRGGARSRWRGCRGAELIDLISELYGQGNALASPFGIAPGWLQLAAAGGRRAASEAPLPHLVAALEDSSGQILTPTTRAPTTLGRGAAQSVLRALERVVEDGSAAIACRNAMSVGGVLRCRAGTGGPRIAAKTGTPLFPDRLTLGEWRGACADAARQPSSARQRRMLDSCRLRPLKWFAALAAPPGVGEADYEYLIVVKAERNFRRADERVDDVGDATQDGNVAAEIGLALINSLYTPTGRP